MISISIQKYAKQFVKFNPSEHLKDVRLRLEKAVK